MIQLWMELGPFLDGWASLVTEKIFKPVIQHFDYSEGHYTVKLPTGVRMRIAPERSDKEAPRAAARAPRKNLQRGGRVSGAPDGSEYVVPSGKL